MPELPLDGEWERAFGKPSYNERWFIEGESASGKSTFVMLFGKKLCEYGRVAYLPLEEGISLSLKRRLKRLRMDEVNGRFKVLRETKVTDLVAILKKPKSPHFVIIDSVQYIGLTFPQMKELLLDKFPRKSFIFVSQVYKGEPKGKAANDLKFESGVKIYTRGFRAYCRGRYIDDVLTYYTIWEEGAHRFYLYCIRL